jgi:Matrixin
MPARLPCLLVALASALLLPASPARGYALFPYDSNGETLYLKWADNHAGTAGGAVSWSLIPPGTPGSATFCASACPGSSLAAINIENGPGQGFSAVPLTQLRGRIAALFARWSAATGLRFVELPSDSGLAINDPGAQPPATGQIRIGIYAFSAGGGAVGYAPPPNGGSGAGDILLDANSFYQFAPGAEGQPFDTTFAPNDFDSLLLHEMGHAVGLAHPPDDLTTCPVMQSLPRCWGVVQRQLDADDRAGAQFLYGSIFSAGFE